VAHVEGRVFSERLESFLEQLNEGETPNSGTFCANCFNPIPPGDQRCDHCGQALEAQPAVHSIPEAVTAMHRRKQRRESLIVNAFAYLGLGIGVALFIALVSFEYFVLHGLWLLLIAILVLIAGSWGLARFVGGVIGDEIAYRSANKRLAEDWAAYVQEREERRK
jgi:hypothetical protein